jgi:hypothetical protein
MNRSTGLPPQWNPADPNTAYVRRCTLEAYFRAEAGLRYGIQVTDASVTTNVAIAAYTGEADQAWHQRLFYWVGGPDQVVLRLINFASSTPGAFNVFQVDDVQLYCWLDPLPLA